ncbi:MAG: DUF2064 domain-containing protein [Cyclonatronaceae bacterium]
MSFSPRLSGSFMPAPASGGRNIAVLFFSRSAAAESRSKQFVKGNAAQNERISRLLIDTALDNVRASGLPCFVFDESQQVGKTFGTRLSNAFQAIYDKGFDAVISVGNDTPALSQVAWPEVIRSLQQGRAVIGPSHSGGAYLIGMPKALFDVRRFQALPWRSSALLGALQPFLSTDGNAPPLLLAPCHDINSGRELRYFLRGRFSGRLRWFQLRLRALLSSHITAETRLHDVPRPHHHYIYSRPPPAAG